MAVKRKLAVKTLAEKCQALRDLNNGISSNSSKNVAEKYRVSKNTVSTWLKNKENFLLRWKNLRTNAKKLGKAIT